MNVNDIEMFLNEVFPKENAMSYDNTGLIAGDREKIVSAVVLSLDLTDKAIETARNAGANLIVTHHPIIFGGIKTLTLDDATGRTLANLIRSGISVISCHTNLDMTNEFGNLAIADKLEAENPKSVEGVECGVVYDIVTIDLMTLRKYCRFVAEKLGSSGIITINNPENIVRRVFVQGGAFDEDSIPGVIKCGADTVVSGEIKHHVCVALEQMGINTVIAGHSATEQAYLPKLRQLLSEKYPGIEFTVNYNNEVPSIL
ncbi:Nif3-like dinuclear metal center hexameric protein [Butyrivibrio sp. AE2032]|uniref:Nif3-like dinuclear metal center hexameric protein n=1 Tax=Butyrivibrio sp. AE2032 TaxID=1458463 RepID=UPI00055538CF|nr:Nif3-like dinuclear metal center hexameric protein [Butyrivibrio sp. AE2032]